MVILEHRRNTWNQIHGGNRNSPRKHRAERRSHTKADHQTVLRPSGHERHRQMRHVLGHRIQGGHRKSVNDEAAVKSLPSCYHGRSVVSENSTVWVSSLEVVAYGIERNRNDRGSYKLQFRAHARMERAIRYGSLAKGDEGSDAKQRKRKS